MCGEKGEYRLRFVEKKKGIQFKIDGTINMMPSKDYPLALKSKKDIKVFFKETTKEITDPKIKDIFDAFPYQIGKCFQNAEGLLEELKKEGIEEWEYYSGWLFPRKGYPVFHAWLGKEDMILDYTNPSLDIEVHKKAIQTVKSKEELREVYINWEMELNNKRPSEAKTFGRIQSDFVFIGTKDTFENSVRIFKSLDRNHSAYRKEGMSLNGLSDMQKEIESRQK